MEVAAFDAVEGPEVTGNARRVLVERHPIQFLVGSPQLALHLDGARNWIAALTEMVEVLLNVGRRDDPKY